MERKKALIVDDEKNIRLTLSQTLESAGLITDTAVNGEEAIRKLTAGGYELVMLDLQMPGMDGMEVLRQVKGINPTLTVIIITAHGTIDSAVEAMKLGAVDFIQKPFSPNEIRALVKKIMEREDLKSQDATNYTAALELAKKNINEKHFKDAVDYTKKAIALDPAKPEVYNLMGALMEIQRKELDAQKFYRMSLNADPTYKPARANLDRTTSWSMTGDIVIDEKIDEKIINNKEEGKK